jgi:hypothetical protein
MVSCRGSMRALRGGPFSQALQATAAGLTGPAATAAGGLLSNGQQWGTQYVQQVQQKVGWFTGGYLNSYFNISSAYGERAAAWVSVLKDLDDSAALRRRSRHQLPAAALGQQTRPSLTPRPCCPPPWPAVQTKLLMLLAPFLKRWTYTRSQEQVRGAAACCAAVLPRTAALLQQGALAPAAQAPPRLAAAAAAAAVQRPCPAPALGPC